MTWGDKTYYDVLAYGAQWPRVGRSFLRGHTAWEAVVSFLPVPGSTIGPPCLRKVMTPGMSW